MYTQKYANNENVQKKKKTTLMQTNRVGFEMCCFVHTLICCVRFFLLHKNWSTKPVPCTHSNIVVLLMWL